MNFRHITPLIALIVLLSACTTSTFDSNLQTEKSANIKKPLIVDINLAPAKIKKSGLGVPKYMDNQLVGYKFKRGFAVPAQIGNYFGFSYSVNQAIDITITNTDMTGNIVKQVPITVTVTHPEIITNGKATTVSSWQDTLYFGRDNFAMWNFESKNELVNGKWNITVEYNNTKVAEKNFFVQVPPPVPEKVTQVCKIETEKFPPFLQQANKECCVDNSAQACYNFAWRGLERLKDKHGAGLYYAKGCALGDISSCRLAAKMAKTEQERNKFHHKGCDLNDFDSCIEVDRLPQ